MILPDVNVLIYAYRTDVPQHAVCRPWLEAAVNEDSAFGLSRLVLSAVVRIVTNPRMYANPESLDEAFAYCNWLSERQNCVMVEPGERHWSIFERLCRETDTRGSRISDAWFAALAVEHGCEWVTLDRDFARFPGLRWRVPG